VDGTVTVEGTSYFRSARVVKNRRAIVLLRPVSSISSAWRPQLEGLLLGALGAVVLAALAAFFVARAISRPVGRVVEASRRLVTEESPPTLPVAGPTELASLAQSFNEMTDQLARAREAERNFLLSVSHELKTPLTAIRGYTEALADEAVTPEEAVEIIAREAERLDRLVHDLLDLARMKRSRFSVRREPVDLASAAREAVRRYAKQAEAFGVELEAAAPESSPATADSDRVLQIVSNLVENALRVTPAGGLVRVVAEPSLLAVEDTGPGLRPDELEHAFERFFLYSRYGGERSVGSGLGLAIVKELAESMGGSVEVRSDPGRGTRFAVRLPRGSFAPSDRVPSELVET
jgi:two-component system sensor histidine kinase BaeS